MGQVRASLYSNPSSSGPIANSINAAGSANVSLRGMAAGTYYVRVFGYTAASYTLTVTPASAPAAPTGVSASEGVYFNRVIVSWTASPGATGYDVYRSITNDPATSAEINSTSITTTTYDDSALTAGTTYYYWVEATSPAGTSAMSGSASGLCATLQAPPV